MDRRIAAIRNKERGDKLVLASKEVINRHHDVDMSGQMSGYAKQIVTLRMISRDIEDPERFRFKIEEDNGAWNWYVDMVDIL